MTTQQTADRVAIEHARIVAQVKQNRKNQADSGATADGPHNHYLP